MAVTFAAHPSGVRFDRASGSWRVTLAESSHHAPLGVSIWDKSEQRFLRLPPDRYAIEQGLSGRVVRFSAPGLYLLSLRGPFGLEDIDLPVLLRPRRVAAVAAGAFSERMFSIFPELIVQPHPRSCWRTAG